MNGASTRATILIEEQAFLTIPRTIRLTNAVDVRRWRIAVCTIVRLAPYSYIRRVG